MKPRYWLVLGAVAVCAGQVVACSSDFSSCAERRTCVAEGGAGVGGKVDGAEAGDSSTNAGKGGSGASGGDSGKAGNMGTSVAGAGDGGAGGEGGEGGAVFGTPALFGACSGVGKFACDGAASAQRLACDGSKWQAGTTCASGELCNSEDGKCLPKVEECADAEPGQVVCRKDSLLTCGPDLVTAELGKRCEGACKDGVCLAPACGDGKVLGDEACDDGNLLPGDGCSATCTPEPTALALGYRFSCALGSNGAVKCWGNNEFGQLGQGDTQNRGDDKGELGSKLHAVLLGSKRKAKAIAARGDTACALLDDNSVKCWGHNDVGQLGTGDQNDRGDAQGEMGDSLKPINLGVGRSATMIRNSTYHTCAVLDNGGVKCWGQSRAGTLGQDNLMDYPDPSLVMTINLGTGVSAQAVDTGYDFNCASLDNGLLKCWGENLAGQLCTNIDQGPNSGVGNDPGEMSQLVGFSVAAGRTVKTFSTGDRVTCALLDNGSVKCWGANRWGEGGGGGSCLAASDLVARPFIDWGTGRKAKSISLSGIHLCAVLDDGTVKCLGNNDVGQLGIGSTDPQDGQSAPLQAVPLERPALQVAAGEFHTCAILDDGVIRCWGGNARGELGVGDTDNRGDAGGLAGVRVSPVDLQF
jgi:cysteine-rich repeat protein